MASHVQKKKKVSSGTHTRSVFLYGSPNAEKRSDLEKLQADYTDAVNFYISLLSDREDCLFAAVAEQQEGSPSPQAGEGVARKGTPLCIQPECF